MRRRYGFVIPILLAALLVTGLPASRAQDDTTIITLAIPEYIRDVFNEDLITRFEAENPGIEVQVVTAGGAGIIIGGGGPQGEIDDVLDDSAEYASKADVLAVSTSEITPETTRAGYYLDLAPLALTDPALNPDDFYPAAWESFRWDNGLWALPVTVNPTLVFYDPAAFDAAGLPYPDSWSSLDDMANAIRALTQFNADGTVAVPGFQSFGVGIGEVILSLLGGGLYDQNTIPGLPIFTRPELENLLTDLLTIWADLEAGGYLDQPTGVNAVSLDAAPLRLGNSMTRFGGAETDRAALLPGGHGGLSINGFAISSGTLYPEAAYALVRFLSNSPQAASAFFGGTPARRSLAGVQVEGGFTFETQSSPEIDAAIQTALENALSTPDLFFAGYLDRAINAMHDDQLDAHAALQAVEEEAIARLDTASARHDTALVVATPVPPVELAPGEIELTFGVNSFISPLPNQDAWDALAQDFAASDPEVGHVTIDSGFTRGLTDLAQNTDCFYMAYNAVPDADLGLLRSLDPLLASDPGYDPDDMISGALAAVQRDGSTWAMPLIVQPLGMRYNPDLLAQVGAIPPVEGWTVDEFENALRALKDLTGDDAPFQTQMFNNSILLMLIAAYGGLPIDYRTSPPTLNFTDPATVDAIRQVLDLAKADYINYSRLANEGGNVYAFSAGEERTIPLYTEVVNGFGIGGGPGMMVISSEGDFEPPQNTDLLTTFPQGRTYTPLAFDVSAAYISASTPNAEACYRFITALAGRLDLIQGMPARRSQITHPALAAAQGQDAVAFYTAIDRLMQRPDAITLPTSSTSVGGGAGFILNFWLNRAFDRYVLDDGDLDRELADAQLFTESYRGCVADLPPADPAADDFAARFQQVIACAVTVDPSAAAFFPQQ